jgi:phage shock protein A
MDINIIVAILGTGVVSVIVSFLLNRTRQKSQLHHLKVTDEISISNTILEYSKQLKEDLQIALSRAEHLEQTLANLHEQYEALNQQYDELNLKYDDLKNKYNQLLASYDTLLAKHLSLTKDK